MTTVTVLRWIIRVGGVLALGLGLALWGGNGVAWLGVYQALGYLVSGGLVIMAGLGFGRRVPVGLLLLALVWGLVVPVVGRAQLGLLPGSAHWIIQIFHVLLGLGALALSEAIAGRAVRPLVPGRGV